ncbi:MAG TPA: histidinol-phosphatase [Micropepsaceae bacterium]|jgi:histidinol phosphatase-like enzyme (inositol monophosphatase family)|nr:histidinol-phosphatase [Micropepsaceae bacterium]
MTADLQSRRALADLLADAAGEVIRPYFRKRVDVTDKGKDGFYDPVTEADRKAEETIRALLAKHVPEDSILGEEFGEMRGTTGFRWVLDPIDGTRAFMAGQPLWGTLIALEKEGKPILGVLDQPFLRERFIGGSGTAEFRNADGSTRLKTRVCAKLADAVICTTHPMLHFKDEERERYWRVERACRLSRYGGDCYAYALIAMGFVDLVIETDLKRWDIAAIIPIIEGAGGILTDWNGKTADKGGNVVAAGDARIHAEALKILSAD